MQISMSTTTREVPHCITQQPKIASMLLDYYSSTMLTQRSMPGMMTDVPHFSLHRRVETVVLCGYCWTTMPMSMSATTRETLHCIMQRSTVTSRLFGYSSSATQRSTPRMTRDRPRYIKQHSLVATGGENSQMWYGYCWTTVRIRICVTITETLHCITQRPPVISRLLGYYSSAMWRSMPGIMTDVPHFLMHRRVETVVLCSYCWTIMPMSMSATIWETLHCIVQRSVVTSRLFGYSSSAMLRSMPRMTRDRPRYIKQHSLTIAASGEDPQMLWDYCWTTVRMRISVTTMETLHCIGQYTAVTSRLLGCYLSVMWRSMPGIMTDVPHFSMHRRVETVMLCGYCWTTMLMSMSATTREALHCITQHSVVTSRLFGCSSSATRRSTPRMTTDRPRYIKQHSLRVVPGGEDPQMLCGYCWTTVRMCISEKRRKHSTALGSIQRSPRGCADTTQ